MDEGEEEEEAEEEEDLEDDEVEVLQPRKRIGRPPKAWSSILLPKEVTSTLGTQKWSGISQKANLSAKSTNLAGGESSQSKMTPTNMVGQTVHGVVDGCFDAGFLVSLRIGDSDHIYRGLVFGPGLSIPVSKEMDIAKNVKRKLRKRNQLGAAATSTEEPLVQPALLPAPPKDDASVAIVALAQPPHHYEALPAPQHTHNPNSTQHFVENTHRSPIPPPLHPREFVYNGAMHANNFRGPPPHPDINVKPFMHSASFPPRASMSVLPSPQGYSPCQNFGHAMPAPSMPYGYSFAGAQGRPSASIPQYRAPTADPQYRAP